MATYAADPPVTVLRNDGAVQAVAEPDHRRTAAVFHAAGTLALGAGRTLAVDRPCLMLLDESGPRPLVHVASPDEQDVTVRVSIAGEAGESTADIALGSGVDASRTVTLQLVQVR
ncbi:hypothetical protein GCM10009609_65570 [Pseudonocardia aurantiaca]|uniref:Polysaccharide lyase beta-sandwich domain-containing protein n=1 Tax=Pseudonocardia aurantiaca TaxID=75290 RepID=A0ABW4FTK9_9PSEU